MEKELFMLLRLGLDNGLEKKGVSLFHGFAYEEWKSLYKMAQLMGVAGIVLDGLDSLSKLGALVEMPIELKKEWIGMVIRNYEARNLQQLQVIDFMQKEWAKAGIRMMVLKGQAMGINYPIPKHRCPGDIDCYLFEDYVKGNDVARTIADRVDEGWYKHSQIFIGGQMIENHRFFVLTREGKRSKKLNRIMVELLNGDSIKFGELKGTNVLLPPPMFNALFLTYHALSHFLEEGLKLKQILDWAMFLKRDADRVDWNEFYRLCDRFHMRRFADVTTDIAVHYLGVKLSNPVICSSSPYTEKVLRSTLYDNDYVFSSGQRGWANRWHIVRNLFKYRWKYHQIYQHSVIRQIWWYAVGFIFKTE